MSALSEGCLRALPPERLLALPPALRRRDELRALLYAVLRATRGLDRLAPEERETARQRYLAAMAWNLGRLDRLDALLAAARADGLSLVTMKGGLLCRTHYGDPGARPMVDLDVLCRPAEVERAVALAGTVGFRPMEAPAFRRAHEAGALHDVKLVDGAVIVELHYRLWHELRIGNQVEGVIERAREIPFGAGHALALEPADHLFVVLVHAAIHGFAGNPLWLTDAALLAAEAGPSVWPKVEALGREHRAELPLAAARDHLALVFPDLQPSAPAPRARLRRALLRRLAPWLQRGESELGPLPSRVVRPLLVADPAALLDWATEKLQLWWSARQ